MGTKLTLEEIRARTLENSDGKIECLDCQSNSSDGTFKCNFCGNIWKVKNSSRIIAGITGCSARCESPSIGDRRRFSNEEIFEIAKKLNCTIDAKNYTNKNSIVVVCFSCGHTKEITMDSFLRNENGLCGDCNKLYKRRIPEKDIIFNIESFGFDFLRFLDEYKNSSSFVEYACPDGHITSKSIASFRMSPTCRQCSKESFVLSVSGKNSVNWDGGIVGIRNFVQKRLSSWKRQSMSTLNGKCFITGDDANAVHHLYPFNKILQESLFEIGLPVKEVGEYSENELIKLMSSINEKHIFYGLGVPLRNDIHMLFHSIYGNKNFTPDDFYEFVDKIQSGEIEIP